MRNPHCCRSNVDLRQPAWRVNQFWWHVVSLAGRTACLQGKRKSRDRQWCTLEPHRDWDSTWTWVTKFLTYTGLESIKFKSSLNQKRLITWNRLSCYDLGLDIDLTCDLFVLTCDLSVLTRDLTCDLSVLTWDLSVLTLDLTGDLLVLTRDLTFDLSFLILGLDLRLEFDEWFFCLDLELHLWQVSFDSCVKMVLILMTWSRLFEQVIKLQVLLRQKAFKM